MPICIVPDHNAEDFNEMLNLPYTEIHGKLNEFALLRGYKYVFSPGGRPSERHPGFELRCDHHGNTTENSWFKTNCVHKIVFKPKSTKSKDEKGKEYYRDDPAWEIDWRKTTTGIHNVMIKHNHGPKSVRPVIKAGEEKKDDKEEYDDDDDYDPESFLANFTSFKKGKADKALTKGDPILATSQQSTLASTTPLPVGSTSTAATNHTGTDKEDCAKEKGKKVMQNLCKTQLRFIDTDSTSSSSASFEAQDQSERATQEHGKLCVKYRKTLQDEFDELKIAHGVLLVAHDELEDDLTDAKEKIQTLTEMKEDLSNDLKQERANNRAILQVTQDENQSLRNENNELRQAIKARDELEQLEEAEKKRAAELREEEKKRKAAEEAEKEKIMEKRRKLEELVKKGREKC
ncbi:uncharacterized protein IL334_005312 [Kwoniella shivajii]|uniref:FAR1 domain-containing protein n=1 Tax=Kwoniella shivajii TaxID=564305 RepID=A0ABZ1D2S7_9TREE|nr:hypothetical protein IL334_005312 [Kwoniella shivajii]